MHVFCSINIITTVGVILFSSCNETIYSQHFPLDTRKVRRGHRCFLAPEGPHLGMCTLFATACVKREFFTSNDLHTARSGPDPIQAKSYFCSIKGEGNTSTGGLLFVELGGTAIAGIKPKLWSFVSLKLSPVELARSLYQAPKHFQAW